MRLTQSWTVLLLISSVFFLLSTPVQVSQTYPAGLSTGTQTQVEDSVSVGLGPWSYILAPSLSEATLCYPNPPPNSPPHCIQNWVVVGTETIPVPNLAQVTTTMQLTELSAFTTSLYDTSVVPGIVLGFLTGNVVPQSTPLILGTVTVFAAVFTFARVKNQKKLTSSLPNLKIPLVRRRTWLSLIFVGIYASLVVLVLSFLADATLSGILLGLLVSVPIVIFRFRRHR